MKCCNDNHDNANNQGNKHKGHMSHMWMMILCCGAPLLILMLLPAIGNIIPGAGSFIGKIVPFLCPLMMILMMTSMFRRDKGNGRKENENHCESSGTVKTDIEQA